MSQKLHIIAEAGSNHNGDVKMAKKLVDIAIRAGADSFKTQFIYPEGLYLPAYYAKEGNVENTVYHQRAAEQISDNNWLDIAKYAQNKGINFTASIFDDKGLDLLKIIDPPYIKLASTDLTTHPLIEKLIATEKPMILSTGMAEMAEIGEAVTLINSHNALDRLILLHCVSLYPCPLTSMNLSMIDELRQNFGVEIGLSDHTGGSEAAIMAIAKGCHWIEKHFTFDKGQKGFDHAHAQDEAEFTRFIKTCRSAYEANQFQAKKLTKPEKTTKIRARRSLYASKNLKKGHVITKEDILMVRPAAPLTANNLLELIGRVLTHNVFQYQAYIFDGDKAKAAKADIWQDAADFWENEMADKGMT